MRHASNRSNVTQRVTLSVSSPNELVTLLCFQGERKARIIDTHRIQDEILERLHVVCLSTNRFANSSESFNVTSSPRCVTT
jgi:hypothetical protein